MSREFRFKYFPFSKLTLFVAAVIVLSASFMRQVMDFTKAYIGAGGFKILIGSILAVSGIVFLIFVIKNALRRERSRPFPTLAMVAIVAIGLFLVWQIEIPEEKIHILEFALLGWLASRDLTRQKIRLGRIILALIFTFLAGLLDETFQGILPYRYFQWWDVALNSAGGAFGIILYLLYL